MTTVYSYITGNTTSYLERLLTCICALCHNEQVSLNAIPMILSKIYACVIAALTPLLTSKLFGFSFVIHFTSIMPYRFLFPVISFDILLCDYDYSLQTFSSMPTRIGEYLCQASLKSVPLSVRRHRVT